MKAVFIYFDPCSLNSWPELPGSQRFGFCAVSFNIWLPMVLKAHNAGAHNASMGLDASWSGTHTLPFSRDVFYFENQGWPRSTHRLSFQFLSFADQLHQQPSSLQVMPQSLPGFELFFEGPVFIFRISL